MAERGSVEVVQISWRGAGVGSPPELLGGAVRRRLHPGEAAVVIRSRGERAELEDEFERRRVHIGVRLYRHPHCVPIRRGQDRPISFASEICDHWLASIRPVHGAISVMRVDVIHILRERILQAADSGAFRKSRRRTGIL